jgi:hypothetical protein
MYRTAGESATGNENPQTRRDRSRCGEASLPGPAQTWAAAIPCPFPARFQSRLFPAPVSFAYGYAVKVAPARLFIRFFRRVPPPLAAHTVFISGPWKRSDIYHVLKSFF